MGLFQQRFFPLLHIDKIFHFIEAGSRNNESHFIFNDIISYYASK